VHAATRWGEDAHIIFFFILEAPETNADEQLERANA
jgi:hypothetical protein